MHGVRDNWTYPFFSPGCIGDTNYRSIIQKFITDQEKQMRGLACRERFNIGIQEA
jgi:hypothetical protein